MTWVHWEYRADSRKSKSLNVLRPEVIKEDHCTGSSLWWTNDPFLSLPCQNSVLSPDQSFKSVKVSKFNTRAAYMRLTCTQGEHLHVFELQRGIGWVQSLAVVCHVHVCQCFGQTNSQLPDSGAERLVQEANVPPPHPLLLLLLLLFSHLHWPPLSLAPPSNKVAPWPSCVMGTQR